MVKVEVVSTKASLTFFDPNEVKKAGARVWTDEDEWTVCFLYLVVTLCSPLLHHSIL
jgi:hypothetical protein